MDEAFSTYLSKRDKVTARELIQIKRKLFDLANGNQQKMLDILNQSLAQGWKGLFELEKDKKPPDKKPKTNFTEREYDRAQLERDLLSTG